MNKATNDQPTKQTSSSSASSTPEEFTNDESESVPEQETTNLPTDEDQQPETDDQSEDGEGSSRERREAKRYRLRLREAEAERDAATAKLNSLADRVLGDQLQAHGIGIEALRSAGHDPTAFFDDAGQFDAEAVDEAARATAEKFGVTRPSAPIRRYSGTGPERTPAEGWAGVIRT